MQKKEIGRILCDYGLGKLRDKERMTEGYANVNYKVETAKGNFLFRIYKQKSQEDIGYEIRVLNELRKSNFPAAFPIKREDGNFITNTRKGPVVVYEYIEGEEPEINKKSVKEVARGVARLNSFRGWREFKRKNPLSLELCNQIIERFDKAENKYPEIFKYFKEQTEFLSDLIGGELPRGLVHGDIFPDNTKFRNNTLVAILDFEEVCIDDLLFDIGMTINGFCFENNNLSNGLLRTLLKEYNKTRKITPKEKELLPYYIQLTAHTTIGWHLKRILNKKDNKKLKRARELMKRVKNLRKSSFPSIG